LSADDGALPLILTYFRTVQFVNEQHRNLPRLRREVRDPVLEIHLGTAASLSVGDGEWVTVETVTAQIKLRAKFTDSLHPNVVCAHYGWWQACQELGLPGLRPLLARRRQRQLAHAKSACRSNKRFRLTLLKYVSRLKGGGATCLRTGSHRGMGVLRDKSRRTIGR